MFQDRNQRLGIFTYHQVMNRGYDGKFKLNFIKYRKIGIFSYSIMGNHYDKRKKRQAKKFPNTHEIARLQAPPQDILAILIIASLVNCFFTKERQSSF
jgi:hypothetical protein